SAGCVCRRGLSWTRAWVAHLTPRRAGSRVRAPGVGPALDGDGLAFRGLAGSRLLAQPEAGEAAHHDVLLEDGDLLLHELAHGQLRVLHERLLEQAEGLVVLLELALGDLVHDRGRLALGRGLRAIDLLLLLEGLPRDLVLAHVERGRGRGGCDVHGDVLHEGLEVRGLGHEAVPAVALEEPAALRARMDVRADHALAGHAPRLLGRRGQTLLAQDVASLVRVSVRLHERALAVHHARARLLPELAHG